MAGYRDIVGHKQIIEHLKRAVSMNKISHAYIFNGEKDSGKRMIAEAFAQTLQCEASVAGAASAVGSVAAASSTTTAAALSAGAASCANAGAIAAVDANAENRTIRPR